MSKIIPTMKNGIIVRIAILIFHRKEAAPKNKGPINAAMRLAKVLKPKSSARFSFGIIFPKKPRAIAGVEPMTTPVNAEI